MYVHPRSTKPSARRIDNLNMIKTNGPFSIIMHYISLQLTVHSHLRTTAALPVPRAPVPTTTPANVIDRESMSGAKNRTVPFPCVHADFFFRDTRVLSRRQPPIHNNYKEIRNAELLECAVPACVRSQSRGSVVCLIRACGADVCVEARLACGMCGRISNVSVKRSEMLMLRSH
jgi:hypothetical protein